MRGRRQQRRRIDSTVVDQIHARVAMRNNVQPIGPHRRHDGSLAMVSNGQTGNGQTGNGQTGEGTVSSCDAIDAVIFIPWRYSIP